ncbi:MAG: molybdenum cofactor guanylyltransferase [Kiritimatiellia bacterium]|jgi:molybdopterin-guanine dinucleotide biosynthesis protein A
MIESTSSWNQRATVGSDLQMNAPLFGLLLAGGKSSRMGCDKASVIFGGDGVTQAERAINLLGKLCQRTYLSLRAGQPAPKGGEGIPVLRDCDEAAGPMSGILAALYEIPDAVWLVLACDLPFVTTDILVRLVARHREAPDAPFIACSSSLDGLPEPLCAIYTPAALSLLRSYAGRAIFSPREIMLREGAPCLVLRGDEFHHLQNMNTPADYDAARRIYCPS